ncbi:Hypothetical predicted protein, partial [Olea europaea subsp. europaea]
GPDDELFPAQETLLHIQTHIVDLVPEKENIITTRLLLQSDEIGCLGLTDGSFPELRKITGANIHILPREEHPAFIVGEIKAAREALVKVTSRLRSYIFRELLELDAPTPVSAPNPTEDLRPLGNERVKQDGSERREDIPNILNRISVPLVTRRTLEIVITPNVAFKLVTKSRNKLTLISE